MSRIENNGPIVIGTLTFCNPKVIEQKSNICIKQNSLDSVANS